MYSMQEKGISSIEELRNKKIVILGFGIEGKSLARYFSLKNIEFSVFDENKNIELPEGAHFTSSQDELNNFDVIIRSPGISPHSNIFKKIDKSKVITSATKLFFDLTPTKKIIGVTGTKGKGTTSTLIYEMLKDNGDDVYLGGNIGSCPFDFIENLDDESWVVLELSSFQLIDVHKSPHIAVMLMTTSEHLDYHKDVKEYVEAKRNIFRFQTENDFAITNQDYPASNESDIEGEGKTYKVSREGEVTGDGCFIKDEDVVLKINGRKTKIIEVEKIALIGRHNLENVCAAVMTAVLSEVEIDSIIEILTTFSGLEHRIELVATTRGVKYFDDSFSTTPETAIAAIESFTEPKILILGGSSKNSDFTELGEVINNSDSIKAIIGIGDEWVKIRDKIRNDEIEIIEGCSDMYEIVQEASRIAEIGDVVLLSPACASFGMFENYKDRGNKFKEEVRKLLN